ncbi:GntR family transcriptional regulator [Fictibacillus phosphorivorans]|uniref:GntR family transcriptional regulator n=1 Tax=Fictibacillus phosphorivorans TaxID=1221500 RepID=A0A165P2D3_9BACL|nr:GntR family transcriptional regulator [Fictibacillus phosphorivorans]KZE68733.1 GntR family transcriptional regulator [Fictibacillus phosphorivorans]
MILNLDPRSNTPIWEQVVHQIKELILKEILLPEDKLPSVRELSSTLLINPNTVSKAYQELERQGIIETLRGKGTFVSATITPRADDQKKNELKQQLKQLLIEASYLGINHQTLSKWLQKYSEELGGKNSHVESE